MNNAFTSIAEICTKLRDHIRTLQVTDSDEPLFDSVELYEMADLEPAMLNLHRHKTRQCYVVPLHLDYSHDAKGRAVPVRRELQLALLIADKDTRSGTEAVFGTEGRAYGLLNLEERLATELTGWAGELPTVYLTPLESDLLQIENREQKPNTTRKAALLIYTTPAGEILSCTGPQRQRPRLNTQF